jgi:hypothetical protein
MPFKKENLDLFLKELAKEFRKRSGKSVPAEIILVGGASVLINYGFREMTYDIDAIINASSSMKEAINYVSDKYGLPNGWMNDDFRKTASYSPKIVQFSKYYRTYANSVSFRTVSGEYLVAMKMMSGRKYKYDLSDIIGVLREQEKRDDSLTLERIKTAVEDLYGSYEKISDEVRQFVEQAIQNGEYAETYASVRKAEAENREVLLEYQDNKPGVITNDNINEIIIALRKRKGQE